MPERPVQKKKRPRMGLRKRGARRAGIARPLESLVFLAPLLLFFELGSILTDPSGALQRQERVVAYHLLRETLRYFGNSALWMPALAVVVILVSTHIVSRRPWRVNIRSVLWMYVESIGLALPMILASSLVLLAGRSGTSPAAGRLIDEAVLGVGAGIYEELVFRLILISVVMMLGCDLLKMPTAPVAVFAIMLSAVLFASHHHPPLGTEPFSAGRFLFRFLAGGYLGAIFYYRGYGPAAGTHVAYNILAMLIAALA
jgi:hypothetical protein